MAANTKLLGRFQLLPKAGNRIGIRSITNKSSKQLVCLPLDSDTIGLLVDGTEKGCLKVRGGIQTYALKSQGKQIFMIIVAMSGDIFTLDVLSQLKRAQRVHRDACAASDGADQIFNELLDNEGSSSTKPLINPDIILEPDPHVKNATIQGNVCDLLIINDCYCILFHEDTGLRCSFYDSTFTKLPQESFIPTMDYKKEKTISSESVNTKPSLYGILPADSQSKTPYYESGRIFTLQNSLFNQFICLDFNLLDIPALLILLPTGQLYSLPVLASPTHSVMHPTLLYDLQQNAVSLHQISYKPSASPDDRIPSPQDFLMLIGRFGKLILITHGLQSPRFLELSLPGLIQCTVAQHHVLLHSSNGELMRSDLASSLDKVIENPAADFSPPQVESTPCGFYKVSALIPVKDPSSRSGLDAKNHNVCNLLAITKNGSLVQMEVNSSKRASPSSPCPFVSSHGNVLRDKVESISCVSMQQAALKKTVAALQVVVNQMAIASTMIVNLQQCPPESGSLPLIVTSLIIISDLGWTKKYVLVIRMKNACAFSLSHGWTLTASVKPPSSGASPQAKSLTFGSLAPGSTVTMEMELDSHVIRCLNLELSVLLSFNVGACLRALSEGRTEDPSDSQAISIPFPVKVFNVLSLLCPMHAPEAITPLKSVPSLEVHSSITSAPKCSWSLRDEVRTILKPPSSLLREMSSKEDKVTGKAYSISVPVSKSQLTNLTSKDGAPVESALLSKLMENNSSISLPEDTMSVHATDPKGDQISISVHKTGSSLSVVLHSCDIELLSQVHLAVLHFFKSVGGKLYKKDVPLSEIRKTLTKFEEIRDDLRECLAKSSSSDIHKQLFAIYETIRNTHLPH